MRGLIPSIIMQEIERNAARDVYSIPKLAMPIHKAMEYAVNARMALFMDTQKRIEEQQKFNSKKGGVYSFIIEYR